MLTASQKLDLHSAHSRYMVAECGSRPYDAQDSCGKFSDYIAKTKELGIDSRTAEQVSWEVVCNYDAILDDAIREGYRNQYLTQERINAAIGGAR